MGAMQLAENEKLFTFTHILRTSGMADTLEAMSNVTIFAPSEAAMYSKESWIEYQISLKTML